MAWTVGNANFGVEFVFPTSKEMGHPLVIRVGYARTNKCAHGPREFLESRPPKLWWKGKHPSGYDRAMEVGRKFGGQPSSVFSVSRVRIGRARRHVALPFSPRRVDVAERVPATEGQRARVNANFRPIQTLGRYGGRPYCYAR